MKTNFFDIIAMIVVIIIVCISTVHAEEIQHHSYEIQIRIEGKTIYFEHVYVGGIESLKYSLGMCYKTVSKANIIIDGSSSRVTLREVRDILKGLKIPFTTLQIDGKIKNRK